MFMKNGWQQKIEELAKKKKKECKNVKKSKTVM